MSLINTDAIQNKATSDIVDHILPAVSAAIKDGIAGAIRESLDGLTVTVTAIVTYTVK